MELSERILKAANSVVNLFVVLTLCVVGFYACFALWDNSRIYAAAVNVQADMKALKPEVVSGGDRPSFEALRAVNPDVCGWVTVDGTNIDFPVLQGKSNMTYVNTDIYGQFSVSGAIFLDVRNDRGYGDAYSVLYGHHMEGGKMFGDLDLFKDEEFFHSNRTGKLILPDRVYDLDIYACVITGAADSMLFTPKPSQSQLGSLMEYVSEKAAFINEDAASELRAAEKGQVLALTTCSTEFTDARTIVLAVMKLNHAEVTDLGGIQE